MNYEYIVNNRALIDVVDTVSGDSIGYKTYLDEIKVPEGTETLASCLFSCPFGAIGRLYLPNSIRLIDSYALSGRTIEKLFYNGSLAEFEKIKTKISPNYNIRTAYCKDGTVDFSKEYFINDLTFNGTLAECKKSSESNWLYRRAGRVHCIDAIWTKNSNNTIEEYLNKHNNTENEPEWLKTYVPGNKPDFAEVLHSKNVYYPGAGMDTQPIETFRKKGISQLFIYADYGKSSLSVRKNLSSELFMYGYDCIGIELLDEKDIVPRGWVQHINKEMVRENRVSNTKGFCLLAVYEKKAWYMLKGEPNRFALLYFGADGIATYDALFGNDYVEPYILVLQDHGFGGNYDRFGAGGLMEKIAYKTGKCPKYIESAENTKIWEGYTQSKNVEEVNGGMHHEKRYLWEQEPDLNL